MISPSMLIAQADALLLLGELLGEPRREAQERAALALEQLSSLAIDGAWHDDTLTLLEDACRAAVDADLLDWHCAYQTLFGPNAICPAHEAAWIPRDRGPMLGDIAGFAEAFGLRLNQTSHERYDHLGAELELLAMLLILRARAADGGQAQQAEISLLAADKLVEDHLGVWVTSFCAALTLVACHPVFDALAAALSRVWEDCRSRHGWRIQDQIAPRGMDHEDVFGDCAVGPSAQPAG